MGKKPRVNRSIQAQQQQAHDAEVLQKRDYFIILYSLPENGLVHVIYNRSIPYPVRVLRSKPPIIVYPLMQFQLSGMAESWYRTRAVYQRPHWLCRIIETYSDLSRNKARPERKEGEFVVLALNSSTGLVSPVYDDAASVNTVRVFDSTLSAWGFMKRAPKDCRYLLVERLRQLDPKTAVRDLEAPMTEEQMASFFESMGYRWSSNVGLPRAEGEPEFEGWTSPTQRQLRIPVAAVRGMTWKNVTDLLGWF